MTDIVEQRRLELDRAIERLRLELEQQRDQIERLRAALQEIAAYPHREEGGEIARRALEPKP